MARSMIQRRQEAARQKLDGYLATLRRVSTGARPPQDLDAIVQDVQRGFCSAVLRDPNDWHPKLKTRDGARLRLAAARYLFARYPIPAFIECIWLDQAGLSAEEVAERKRWYIVAAQGGSLHKTHAKAWLSRKEVHAFLAAPRDRSFEGAFWYAVASSYTDDRAVALRVARSRLGCRSRADFAFWREAARFFCVYPAPLNEIDDLCDFLAARREADPAYSLTGRTPTSLRRQMEEWHRHLALVRSVSKARWDGSPSADWFWEPPPDETHPFRGSELMVVQLKTGADLAAEGRAMGHCVSTYCGRCLAGVASVWSLRRRTPLGALERLVTIELNRDHRFVQVRGPRNRMANTEEKRVIARWARERGIGSSR